MKTDGNERMYTPLEVAIYLSCSLSTVYKMRHQADGPEFVREGRKTFYTQSALDKWIKDHTVFGIPGKGAGS